MTRPPLARLRLRAAAAAGVVAALALTAPGLAAQLEAGMSAPDLEGEAWVHRRPTKLSELRGRVVLLDFFDASSSLDSSWSKKSRKTLRSLHKKHGAKGLEVIGVTSGDPDEVEEALSEWNMPYAVFIAEGEDALHDDWGFQKDPKCYLVSPDGRVAWRGSVYDVSAERVERYLAAATVIPPLTRHPELNEHLRFASLQCGKAHRALEKAAKRAPDDTELQRALSDLELLFARQVEDVEFLVARKDFAVAIEAYAALEDEFEGCPLAKRAKQARTTLARDAEAKRDVAAAKLLKSARALQSAAKEQSARRKYDTILERYGDTRTAERARRDLERLSK